MPILAHAGPQADRQPPVHRDLHVAGVELGADLVPLTVVDRGGAVELDNAVALRVEKIFDLTWKKRFAMKRPNSARPRLAILFYMTSNELIIQL